MFRWLFYLILSIIYTIICYPTNPIVVLFADDDGELPGFLSNWQTWDNSCNPSDLVKLLPKWMTTWYDGHYAEIFAYIGELADVGRGRWYTECYNKDFTLWQRFTRYLCRVYWLTRNSAYGFCFWQLGVNCNPLHEFYIKESDGEFYIRDLDEPEIWSYSNSRKIFWKVHWNIFLGWKLVRNPSVLTRCMIANRITLKIEDK